MSFVPHPEDSRALFERGHQLLRSGDLLTARELLQRAAAFDERNPLPWIDLAQIHEREGDDAAEEQALFKALSADPQDLMALLMRGRLCERQGRRHEAARAFGAAATVAPPLERLVPELRPALQHALRFRGEYDQQLARFIDEQLAAAKRDVAGEDLSRFELSVDILLGRRRRYESQPMNYFVPQLAPVEFFERSLFPWIEAMEAATEDIAGELITILESDSAAAGLQPYITYRSDQPLAQWAELNHSPRWSAFHLWKDGAPVAENIVRCPKTVAAWMHTPRPVQAGRTPVAMFSLLQPRTRIPPHVGGSNARLVCHLPLIVPAGCRFRVGNSVREWQRGKVWVFDDTIEHEAINDSEQLRAILIFDTWHPSLTPAEQRLIGAMNEALNRFTGAADPYSA